MSKPLETLLLSLADDELILGHRDAEWTGHAPLIEEDIAFSNIAQDEIGHALGWYKIYESITGDDPDRTAFLRDPDDFRCCHFVQMPKGDWAYTVVRQFFFDAGEIIRLAHLKNSTHTKIRELATKIYPEEQYHLLHTRGNVLRLGNATEESHGRMQRAVDDAFGQALGLFESLPDEEMLVNEGIYPANGTLEKKWLESVVPILEKSGLQAPVEIKGNTYIPLIEPVYGGRQKRHTVHLTEVLNDMQLVYRSAPEAKW
jgi:ring-1,2-phenylacetyl-CoA epoxidase subunit PaaC